MISHFSGIYWNNAFNRIFYSDLKKNINNRIFFLHMLLRLFELGLVMLFDREKNTPVS